MFKLLKKKKVKVKIVNQQEKKEKTFQVKKKTFSLRILQSSGEFSDL